MGGVRGGDWGWGDFFGVSFWVMLGNVGLVDLMDDLWFYLRYARRGLVSIL